MKRGLVLGAFMPPHAGHQLLVDTALGLVDQLTILVCSLPDDPIAGPLRLRWMRELYPQAHVIGLETKAPQAPEQDQRAWALWRQAAAAAHLEGIDLVITADPSALRLSEGLAAETVIIDPERRTVPIASSAIRADPMAHWSFLPAPVRAHFARTICLHGPESTGKSTLAPRLARHFETIFVPEYGRTYCEQHGTDLSMSDLVAIARTHEAIAAAALRRCNRRLILDTDPLMTAAWADMLFGRQDVWFERFDHTAHLYLLLDTDLPWVDDGTRFFGEAHDRRRFFDMSRAELDRRGLPYVVIGGSAQERFDRAVAAIAAAGL